MKLKVWLSFIAGFAAIATVTGAEKQKSSTVDDYPFWASKKRGYVSQHVPGLTAALQLSATQRDQISAARNEVAQDEAVKAARSVSKNDPSITAEQREKARATLEKANLALRERVAGILTPDQKALIEKIDGAHAAAVEETGVVYQDKFSSVKTDAAARRRIQEEKNQDIEEQFLHKLDDILTASQKEAMNTAAQEEEQRKAQADSTKKPVKK